MQTFDDFEPLTYYTETLKERFRKNAEELFESLVQKSGVRVEENQKTVAQYNAAVKKRDVAEKKLNSCKLLRGFMIFFLIAAVIAGAVFLYRSVSLGAAWLDILLTCLCFALAIVLAALLFTVIKKTLERRQKKYDAAVRRAQELLDAAYAQMRPLHALFTQRMTRDLIEKTEPDIQIDDYFDMKRFELMSRKYGLRENDDQDSSTVCVLSGVVEGNPFLYERDYNCRIRQQVYTGSLVIHWVTYSCDSRGRSRTVHHSQTLTATYTAPAPVYSYNTRLYYGNEAAPDLTFSRQPTFAHNLSEKEVERKVKKGKRRLQKRMRKALESGKGQFTEMGNAEFDVLFGALDRDNEVQFRLMFTPLAQKNMVELIRSDEAYGDDFAFIKTKMLNCIRSVHAQSWQIEPDVERYKSYDLAASRSEFINFNCAYFRSLYFDLAPLLAIPLYKMQKPREYIYKDIYYRNCTSFESEALANRFGNSYFAHPESKTNAILKAQFVQKDGLADKVEVTAYSYNAVPRVAYIPVMGGDGRMHNVPVPWTEYLPLTRRTEMEVKPVGGTREQFEEKRSGSLNELLSKHSEKTVFCNGLLAIPILQGMFDVKSDSALNAVLGIKTPEKWSETAHKVAEALEKASEAEKEIAAADGTGSAPEKQRGDGAAEDALSDEAPASEQQAGEDTAESALPDDAAPASEKQGGEDTAESALPDDAAPKNK